jgi:HEAT repeat protein
MRFLAGGSTRTASVLAMTMHRRDVAVASLVAVVATVVLMSVHWFVPEASPHRTAAAARERAPARTLTEPKIGQPHDAESSNPPPAAPRTSDPDARVLRKNALESIAAAADSTGPQAVTTLVEAALSHRDSAVREEAVRALGERSGGLAIQTLEQTIQDPDPEVRVASVRALADVGTDEAVRILSGALSAADPSLRLDVVEALGDIGSPNAALYLEQALGDESQPVHEAAAQWLDELSGCNLPHPCLASPPSSGRGAAW